MAADHLLLVLAPLAEIFFFFTSFFFWFLLSVAKCLIPTLVTMKYDGRINIIQSILASSSTAHFPRFQRIVKIRKIYIHFQIV